MSWYYVKYIFLITWMVECSTGMSQQLDFKCTIMFLNQCNLAFEVTQNVLLNTMEETTDACINTL